MLTPQDKAWLSQKYKNLTAESDEKITGEITLTATYNEQSNRFLEIEKDTNDGVGGLRLSGTFRITLEARKDFRDSKLPALFVDGVDPIPSRHFNQSDHSGCVCNPLEEYEYLEPKFDFQRYFKELVVPFLYGQLFFSKEEHWPWFEYAHGGLGLVEAFSKNPTPDKARECIAKIARELSFWRVAKPLLSQRSDIKGHTICTCERHDQLRRCHPVALEGFRLLKAVVSENHIPLP